jgi:hypothetical protein
VLLGIVGWNDASLWPSYLSLALVAFGSLLVTVWLYRREEG